VRRDGECQPRIHADRITFDGRVEELLDAREIDDLVELGQHFPTRHAEDGAVQEDVLAPGQLGMETGSDFEQAGYSTVEFHSPARRLQNARQDLEQGRLSGAVATDDADDLAALDLEIDVAQCPELFQHVALDHGATAQHIGSLAHDAARAANQRLTQDRAVMEPVVPNDEALAELVGTDDDIGHGQIMSAKLRSVRRKVWMPNHSMKAVTTRLSAKPGR
jgi:hypothetical protein